MSSLFGLAEQVLSASSGGRSSNSDSTARTTGGREYNAPHYNQQPQGGFNAQEVLSHADDVDEEGKGYIANAIQHVHNNSHQAHNEQLQEDDLSKYGPMIMSALSSVSSKSGLDVSALMSGGLGEGGGNQLMGMVMKEASNAFVGGGQEKQSMMNGAAMTLAKVVAQKQLSAFTGGSNSGGLGMLQIGETLLKSRFG